MRHSMILTLLLAFSLPARADALLLSDLKAQNGVQLTADELKKLMPGASVVNRIEGGSTRRWTNDLDGKFIASSDNRSGLNNRAPIPASAQGTWRVADNGMYCVTLEWRALSENWCRYIFRLGEKYYGVSTLANNAAKAYEFEFSK